MYIAQHFSKSNQHHGVHRIDIIRDDALCLCQIRNFSFRECQRVIHHTVFTAGTPCRTIIAKILSVCIQERQKHLISYLQAFYLTADFNHFAHILVSEHDRILAFRHTFEFSLHQMYIRSADTIGNGLRQCLLRSVFRLRNLRHRYSSIFVNKYSFHIFVPLRLHFMYILIS